MRSQANTVAEYLTELPEDRRAAIETVRAVVLKNLDGDYEEGIQYGMISWYVPHRVFPPGYHCDPKQPLPYASLASQKNHMALYMMCLYSPSPLHEWFRGEWAKTGKKLDMGKACLRFQKVDDLALDLIGEAFRRTPAKSYIEFYQKAYENRGASPAKKSAAAKKPAAARKSSSPKSSAVAKKATRKTAAKKAAAKKSAPRKK